MAKIDIELAITAHKFTCPYYSLEANNKGLPKPIHCGATDIHHQTECNGECWYMKHFKELINGLIK